MTMEAEARGGGGPRGSCGARQVPREAGEDVRLPWSLWKEPPLGYGELSPVRPLWTPDP